MVPDRLDVPALQAIDAIDAARGTRKSTTSSATVYERVLACEPPGWPSAGLHCQSIRGAKRGLTVLCGKQYNKQLPEQPLFPR